MTELASEYEAYHAQICVWKKMLMENAEHVFFDKRGKRASKIAKN